MEIQSPHYEFHDNLHLSPDQVFLFTKTWDSGHSWGRPVPGILTIGMALAPTQSILIVQVSQTKNK